MLTATRVAWYPYATPDELEGLSGEPMTDTKKLLIAGGVLAVLAVGGVLLVRRRR